MTHNFPILFIYALLLGVMLGFTSCTSSQEPQNEITYRCLPIAQVQGTQTMDVVSDEGEVLYQARLGAYRGQCTYAKNNELTISFVLPVIFNVSPAFTGDTVAGAVFIGIIDNNDRIIAKSVLPIEGAPELGRGRLTITQAAQIDMGIVDPVLIVQSHAIVVGLQVTAEQLAANRAKNDAALIGQTLPSRAIDPIFDDKLPIRITGPDGSLL